MSSNLTDPSAGLRPVDRAELLAVEGGDFLFDGCVLDFPLPWPGSGSLPGSNGPIIDVSARVSMVNVSHVSTRFVERFQNISNGF